MLTQAYAWHPGLASEGHCLFSRRVPRPVENGWVAPTNHALSKVEWVACRCSSGGTDHSGFTVKQVWPCHPPLSL